jgi:hypothetical protein
MTQSKPCSCIICKKLISNLGIPGHFKLKHSAPAEMEHQKKCFTEAGNRIRKGMKAWNYGLTGDERVKHSEETKEKLRNNPNKGKGKTLEAELIRKLKISIKAQKYNGGYRENSGRGKKGWYKGFYCHSSWELAFVIYHLDNQIPIKRFDGFRNYEFNGKIRKYFPDFIVNDEIIEIKGYVTKQWKAKHLANPDIKVLVFEDLKLYLNFVIEKYGKNFIEQYE